MALGFKHVPRAEASAAILSITVAVVLLGIKFVAYFVTGSTVIFADALEGIVNVTAAAFATYALTLAHRPADKDHPYGHGKIEFFSAGFEGGMILLAALVAIGKAADTLVRGRHLQTQHLIVGVVLMVIALATNGLVGLYLIRIGKRQSSLTLEADGWHLISDAVTSTAALAALLLVQATGWMVADPIAAIGVSIYIAWMGLGLVRRSAAGLMDEQDLGDEAMFRRILDAHVGPRGSDPRVCSYHKLRHRHSGRYHWVDFHLVVPKWWDIERGHRVASAIEYEMEQAMNEGNATAHVEPCEQPECENCEEHRAVEMANAKE
jgi:cation diffusion facilitator family transporter